MKKVLIIGLIILNGLIFGRGLSAECYLAMTERRITVQDDSGPGNSRTLKICSAGKADPRYNV